MATVEVVDYAFTAINEQALAAAGKVGAGRYVGPGSAGKHLTPTEVKRLHAAGLSIWLNVEGAAGDASAGWSLGIAHATQGENARIALGAPAVPLYFAVDFDVTPGQWPSVRQYLRGAATVVGFRRVGVYGGINAVTWADRDACAAWFFQTYAWSGGRWFPGNHIEQYHNGVALAGGTVDLGRAKQANYGQWAPPGAPAFTRPKEADMAHFLSVPNGGQYMADPCFERIWPFDNYPLWQKVYAAAGKPPTVMVDLADVNAGMYGQMMGTYKVPRVATTPGTGPSAAEIATAVVDEEHARLAD
jgi:hypothetical protein